MLDQIK
jgi:hypothetical protein